MAYERERAAAVEAVILASRLCAAVQQKLVAGVTLEKGDKSPVTVADYGAQAIVSHVLGAAFPAIPLVGEEDAAALRDPKNAALAHKVGDRVRTVLPDLSDEQILAAIDRGVYTGGPKGRHWVLDPIDGTKGFLRVEQYAVALALVEDGEVVIGALGCPNLWQDPANPSGARGCIFVAVKGEGAFQRGLDDATERRVHVDPGLDPAHSSFTESVEKEHTDQSESALIAAELGLGRPPIRMDSQCKYGVVARGEAAMYLRLPTRKDYVERIWDHAGGWRVVVEAGGHVTDVNGKPLDFSIGRGLEANSGVIVTNGRWHDRVLAATAKALRAH